ncbi:MAG TPA: trypsin-like peptidase domain-containing protein [Hyphomonas sp.]|nr:trypsin-like peptidase domain-containing protein [Hyphomonas sp.]
MPRIKDLITGNSIRKFPIDDPFGVREVVQPLVSISQVEDKITGIGTCFQVSPWRWITAHHVVRHDEKAAFPPNEVGAVGFSPGLIFGTVGFSTNDYFAPIVETHFFKPEDQSALSWIPGPSPPGIMVDVASLFLNTAGLKKTPLTSPLPISNQSPKIGEEVLGIGFPILGSEIEPGKTSILFKEQMYGAVGKITKLHPNGVSASFPWPTIEIEGDWEGGMSGGPVIDLNGRVIGVVSRSLAPADGHPGIGYAVNLSQIPLKILMPELDTLNPGFVFGWGIFVDDTLAGFTPHKPNEADVKYPGKLTKVQKISLNPKTEDWIAVN